MGPNRRAQERERAAARAAAEAKRAEAERKARQPDAASEECMDARRGAHSLKSEPISSEDETDARYN
jgi:hypothetical protein